MNLENQWSTAQVRFDLVPHGWTTHREGLACEVRDKAGMAGVWWLVKLCESSCNTCHI